MAQGYLQVDVVSDANSFPVQDADIVIARTEEPDEIIEETRTNSSGQTENLPLDAPPLELSLSPEETERPYAEYTIRITAPGFEPFVVSGTEVLADVTAIQGIRLRPLSNAPDGEQTETVTIPDHTLYGDYLPKIAESEIKPVIETGEIVLSRVVVPQTVVVHDGVPTNASAANYYVPYRDYIKNVASSEIYATWPDATIRANVLAIMSFTLNRVYTEWYRGKGYVFTITSSTAYDHKFSYGRHFFQSISQVVDEMFENYLSRPNVRQPILTQYCDGQRVTCPDWMSQWGSKYLGDQGYSAIDILRSYYGNDMYINSAEGISGIPASWPGYDLGVGASGPKVRQLQEQLARISRAYPAIPTITADGVYGSRTREAVEKFQSVFGLPVTGIVDYPTWYKISDIYVAVSRIAELV